MTQDTRKKILETALKLFSQKGYLGATTKEIASLAGIAEITLFRYFSSKEILFEEVINNFSFYPKLKEILNEIKDKPYKEALVIIALEFLNLLESKKELIKIMQCEMERYPDKIQKIHDTIIYNTIQLLSSYFKTLQERGMLRKFESEIGAQAFLGMFFSYFYGKEIKKISHFREGEVKRIVEEFVDIFINGTSQK
ncbi:MAG: TetR/AcrR family transcriptional regulator [Thermodesulfobacteriaceae bacterium]|nr:TetR/AcrR family transcriptional regulator [Thermodesulfobacteriaceae bacterium]